MSLSWSEDEPDPRFGKYQVGQSVVCCILKAEKGGYTALLDDDVPAFLHTKSEFTAGDEVAASVISIGHRVLLSDRIAPVNVIASNLESGKTARSDFVQVCEKMYLTQTETNRDGSGKPPRKTTLGYSDDGDEELKPGQSS